MKHVVVYPRGQLTASDRASLEAADFCVVEADDPRAVVTMLPSAPMVTANEMLLCALKAMSAGSSVSERSNFTAYLTQAMERSAGGGKVDA